MSLPLLIMFETPPTETSSNNATSSRISSMSSPALEVRTRNSSEASVEAFGLLAMRLSSSAFEDIPDTISLIARKGACLRTKQEHALRVVLAVLRKPLLDAPSLSGVLQERLV